jgi:hypothetical protein
VAARHHRGTTLELRAKRSIGASDLVLAALTNAPTTAL